jgi:hypothetical protein
LILSFLVPSQGPTNISAKAKENTITVSWQPIPTYARNGIITSYVIYYKKARTSDVSNTLIVSNGAATNADIKGPLESLTEYRIEMAGATTAGVGKKSKAVFATTGTY